MLRTQREALLRDCEAQSFANLGALPERVRRGVAPLLRCAPARLVERRAILRRKEPTLADCWPDIALVHTWTGGSCGIPLEHLRKQLPPDARIAELGYIASELRGTLNMDTHRGACVPALHEVYFEFAERRVWDDGAPALLELHELEGGREYYVVVTTRSGLYRYFMNDIVRVTGMYGRTPALAFVQKGFGAGEAYHRHCVERGQREGQLKVQVMQYADALDFAWHRVALGNAVTGGSAA